MTKPAPGKTYEAFSQASLPDYKVDVILAGRRRGNSANFALLTFKPHASSRKETCSATLDEWKRLCEAINKILAEELKAESLQWLTHKDAEALWRRSGGPADKS